MRLIQGEPGIQIVLLKSGARILYWKGVCAALMTMTGNWYANIDNKAAQAKPHIVTFLLPSKMAGGVEWVEQAEIQAIEGAQ